MDKYKKVINKKSIKIAGLCGLLLPIVVFTSIAIAMSHSPWFDWSRHALSDLGIHEMSAIFFNSGMIIAGILIFIFALGLIKILSNKIGGYLLLLASLSLIGIGIFPESVYTAHFIVSASFFILLAFSLISIGITLKKNKFEQRMSLLAFLFAIIALLSTLFLIPWKGIAIPESLSCFPAFVWCMVYGIKMLFI